MTTRRITKVLNYTLGFIGFVVGLATLLASLSLTTQGTAVAAPACNWAAGGMVNPCATLDTSTVSDSRPVVTVPDLDGDTAGEGQDVFVLEYDATDDQAMADLWEALPDSMYDDRGTNGEGVLVVPVGTTVTVPAGVYTVELDEIIFAPSATTSVASANDANLHLTSQATYGPVCGNDAGCAFDRYGVTADLPVCGSDSQCEAYFDEVPAGVRDALSAGI